MASNGAGPPLKKGPAVSSPNGTQAVERAARLLIQVTRHRDPVTFTELTEASGLAKSTASRLLTALERSGLVRRDPAGRFAPGEVFVSYACRGDAEADLVAVAQPALDRLGAQTGETVNLGVPRAGGLVEQIAQVDSTYLIGGTNWVGMSVPLHCAALGKVLLAYGAAELPPRPAGAAHRADPDQPRRPRGRPGPGPGAGLGGDRRGTGARPGGGGRAGAAGRRRGGGGGLGVGPGQPADRRRGARRGGALRGGGRAGIRRARLPAGVSSRGIALLMAREKVLQVTRDELLKQLYDLTLVGNRPAVLDLTRAGLDMGLGPEVLLYEALIPSLEEVGARFERGDFFVPEMLIAGKAMAGALDILRPLLAETGAETIGKIVMGTVKGDVHDIGKNLVNIMFEGAGFEVIDLGVQVAPEKFIAAIQEHQPDIVGFSAFLTTTMPMFKANLNALEKAGLRGQVIVMVGGAPVTQEYADVVGADGYAADASAAVVKAKELLKRRRALASA